MAATPPAEPAPPSTSDLPSALPAHPSLSTADDGLSQRPRDARVLHLILSSLGIHSYQDRVPLQLLDFAYRYTSSILSDSLRLSAEGYTSTTTGGKRAAASGDAGDGANITVAALRQAIASRLDNSFVTALPKEFMLEQAAERNRVALPRIEKAFGLQLPHERYVLTGTPWGLKEEWDSDEEKEEKTNGVVKEEKADVDEEMEDGDGFEDVFGEGA